MPYRSHKIIFAEKVVREEPAGVLLPQLKKLLNRGLLDEIHLWNYGKTEKDKSWLQTLSAERIVKPVSISHVARDDPSVLNMRMVQNGVDFQIETEKIPDDQASVLISMSDAKTQYILELGIKGRAKLSHFRNQSDNTEVNSSILLVPGLKHDLSLVSTSKRVTLKIDEYVWSWPGSLTITAIGGDEDKKKNPLQLYIPDAETDFWQFYYERGTTGLKDCIFVFADSEIIQITDEHFQRFLDCRIDNPNALIHANTVNNDVTAYYQQKIHGVIPQTLMDIPKPGQPPVLSESSVLCRALHQLYISNPNVFSYSGTECVDSSVAVSLDCFALAANQLKVLKPLTSSNDASESTVVTVDSKLANVICNKFVASKFVCPGQKASMTEATARAILDMYNLGISSSSTGSASLPTQCSRQIMTLQQWLQKNAS